MLHQLLEKHVPATREEETMKRQLMQFLAGNDNAYARENLVGHVVADAWIVNAARTHVLLVEHALYGAWMAPGGHCDGNPDVFSAALREAEEEAGITNLKPLLNGEIFDINSGYVPMREKAWGIEPAHIHFDICFAFEGDDKAPLKISDESTGLKWVPLDDIKNINFNASHMQRVTKSKNL